MGRGTGLPAKTGWSPHGQDGCRTVALLLLHCLSLTTTRAGPYKHVGRLMGRMVRPTKNPSGIGCCPDRPTLFETRGPLPGPAHQGIRACPARPTLFSFFTARLGLARHIEKKSWPGPAIRILDILISRPARPTLAQIKIFRLGPARPINYFLSTRPRPARTRAHDKPWFFRLQCFALFLFIIHSFTEIICWVSRIQYRSPRWFQWLISNSTCV